MLWYFKTTQMRKAHFIKIPKTDCKTSHQYGEVKRQFCKYHTLEPKHNDWSNFVDVDRHELFTCKINTARRKKLLNIYEMYIAAEWYYFLKTKGVSNRDTLIYQMARFSQRIYLALKKEWWVESRTTTPKKNGNMLFW